MQQHIVTIQACHTTPCPLSLSDIETLGLAVLTHHGQPGAINIRLVDPLEMTQLNTQYRGKSGPTDVLSFGVSSEPWPDPIPPLGDVVICIDVVLRQRSHTAAAARTAHLVVHGCLHLLGWDHDTSQHAEQMERIEVCILSEQGWPNPYACH